MNNGIVGPILVLLYVRNGLLTRLSMELASLTAELGSIAKIPAHGAILHSGEYSSKDLEDILKGIPLENVYVVEGEHLSKFVATEHASALCEVIDLIFPCAVLAGGDDRGKDIVSIAASIHGSGLTADCTDLSLSRDGLLLQTRPAFGGNILADIISPESLPQFATVREGVFNAYNISGATPKIIRITAKLPNSSSMHVVASRETKSVDSLADAKYVAVLGRGVKSLDDIQKIKQVFSKLGFVVASTRGLVERGLMPQRTQIGLSGFSVSPKLLVAIGVSGSVQFCAGIKGAERIIAINNDPNARIFEVAHTKLCIDLYNLVDELASIIMRRVKE